jgi:hypothetical protein
MIDISTLALQKHAISSGAVKFGLSIFVTGMGHAA